MYETWIKGRNAISRFLYQYTAKPIFFLFDPEDTHNLLTLKGRFLGSNHLTRGLITFFFGYQNKKLEQTIAGIRFPNPLGLAAGFDKDAHLTAILPAVGFGYAEVGSITGEPCQGNPRPRLWRLKQSKGLVIYYGLKNQGCAVIAEKLKNKQFAIPVGTSVAMTNCAKNLDINKAIKDYAKAFRAFAAIGSYTTVNISCPNAQGGQPFSDPANLDRLLSELDKITTTKPIFLKMSPDLAREQINSILDMVKKHHVNGFICTNLTKNRNNPKIVEKNVPAKGGISGKPVEDLSNDLIRYLYKKIGNQYVIIGCGGIFSATDAYKKIKAGASLLQMITGLIFEGPQVISAINQGLVKLLKQDGYQNISEAVGTDSKMTHNL